MFGRCHGESHGVTNSFVEPCIYFKIWSPWNELWLNSFLISINILLWIIKIFTSPNTQISFENLLYNRKLLVARSIKHPRRYMAGILPIRHKTQNNRSIIKYATHLKINKEAIHENWYVWWKLLESEFTHNVKYKKLIIVLIFFQTWICSPSKGNW